MSRVKYTRDSVGISQILKSAGVRNVISGVANQVAANVSAQIDPAVNVRVDDYETDRAASSVTIRDSRGRQWQVTDGVLTRAAAETGLEVTERP